MTAARTIKHFSLHRIAATELRVVADVEAGVIGLIRVQEEVLRKYAALPQWQQKQVTLFVLRNLEPLIQQLAHQRVLPPGGLRALDYRPLVNIYDLANLTACHIFVNQQAMAQAQYWDDDQALTALLAHEHAHPLAENETTRALRQIEVTTHPRFAVNLFRRGAPAGKTREWQDRIAVQVGELVEKLCLYGPRELFANEVTIQSGFGDALFYLDSKNVQRAAESLSARDLLRERLRGEAETGGVLTERAAAALLLLGDMQSQLDLGLEIAAFVRQGKQRQAQELEGPFRENVLARLEPEIGAAYHALRAQYISLPINLTRAQVVLKTKALLAVLDKALRAKGVALDYQCRSKIP